MKTVPNVVLSPRRLAAYIRRTPQSLGALRPRGMTVLIGRKDNSKVYLTPYPIFCLKVVMISLSRSPTLSSIFERLTISFLTSGWCCCT